MGMVTMDHTYEVHQIKTYHQMWSNYCYIIADRSKKSAIAVDPSWEIDKITDKLHELDVDLSAILLTHSHYDHVNLAEPLQQIYHSDIYMSSAEIDFYQFRCRNLIALEDGQTFAAGGFVIRSILTPGHTAGGMCYLLSDHLFTGDTVFTEGCGICEDRGSSAEDMFHSIQRIKASIPPHVRVYPGHSFGEKPGQKMESLLKNNIYFQIEKKEHFVNFRNRKNQKGLFHFK